MIRKQEDWTLFSGGPYTYVLSCPVVVFISWSLCFSFILGAWKYRLSEKEFLSNETIISNLSNKERGRVVVKVQPNATMALQMSSE